MREPKADLPKEVVKVVIGNIDGDHDSLPSESCTELTRLLHRASKKVEMISICNVEDSSPEYLTLLLPVCNNTKLANFEHCLYGDQNFGCLSASLLQQDGLKGLDICFNEDLRNERTASLRNARLLLKVVAASPLLKALSYGYILAITTMKLDEFFCSHSEEAVHI
ncbi:unnamed protein product [Cylindrotheca closterium]|uniref:Uncharacterized protein n=1 Tax=Cylindrotheca closterium TaxID=2856 RepID=A0AAD2CJU1_9STRA|nr:unnamed protein product [Cylindrotheca closterium]